MPPTEIKKRAHGECFSTVSWDFLAPFAPFGFGIPDNLPRKQKRCTACSRKGLRKIEKLRILHFDVKAICSSHFLTHVHSWQCQASFLLSSHMDFMWICINVSGHQTISSPKRRYLRDCQQGKHLHFCSDKVTTLEAMA